MGSGRVDTALELIEEGYAMLATESFDTQSHPEPLGVQSRLEAVSWEQPAITHKLIARLTAQVSPVELGGTSWTDVLSNRLRIGRGEARRRLDEASELGPRIAMTGEPLEPLLPIVAVAPSRRHDRRRTRAHHPPVLHRPAHRRRLPDPPAV
jgi:hypothetical protein